MYGGIFEFLDIPRGEQGRPLKRGGRVKIEGGGLNNTGGKDAYMELLALVVEHQGRERWERRREGEVGNQEMVHFSRIKSGGELKG